MAVTQRFPSLQVFVTAAAGHVRNLLGRLVIRELRKIGATREQAEAAYLATVRARAMQARGSRYEPK